MKIKYIVLSLLPLSLIACQSAQNVTDSVITQINTTAVKNLTEYTWSYQPADTKKPIVLSFSKDHLSIDSGCNRQGTTWKVENDLIITGDMFSTEMACEPALMKQEQFTADLLQKREISFHVDRSNPDQPSLVISDTKGQKYTFIGTMTPETKYQSEGKTVFLEIW